MLQKNNGSILIMTVFVFLLINIIALTSSALVLSSSKYSKYNYEEIYMKEQCLSQIELVYSNILKEVNIALIECKDLESFENYFINEDFINKIEENLGQNYCEVIKIEDKYIQENTTYYRILSKSTYHNFNKTITAYIKIENPFSKVDDNTENNNLENSNEDFNKIKSSDLVKIFDYKEV